MGHREMPLSHLLFIAQGVPPTLDVPNMQADSKGWWRGTVERTSVLAGELSLLHSRPSADR